jgi:O-antigen/teichoic acid export membrane protein
VFGWTKTLPVTIGRPGLRVIAHAVESGVLLALIIAFGRLWGVTGAGAAVLVSTLAYAGVWVVLLNVIRAERKFPEGNAIG